MTDQTKAYYEDYRLSVSTGESMGVADGFQRIKIELPNSRTVKAINLYVQLRTDQAEAAMLIDALLGTVTQLRKQIDSTPVREVTHDTQS